MGLDNWFTMFSCHLFHNLRIKAYIPPSIRHVYGLHTVAKGPLANIFEVTALVVCVEVNSYCAVARGEMKLDWCSCILVGG